MSVRGLGMSRLRLTPSPAVAVPGVGRQAPFVSVDKDLTWPWPDPVVPWTRSTGRFWAMICATDQDLRRLGLAGADRLPGLEHSPITPSHPRTSGQDTPEPVLSSCTRQSSAIDHSPCSARGPAPLVLSEDENTAAGVEDVAAYASHSCLAQPVCRFESRLFDALRRDMAHHMARWLPTEPPHLLASTIMFADSVRAHLPSSSTFTWVAAVEIAYKFHGCAVHDHRELTLGLVAMHPQTRTWLHNMRWTLFRKKLTCEQLSWLPRVSHMLARPDAAVCGEGWSQEVFTVASKIGADAWPAQRWPTGHGRRGSLAMAVSALIEATCAELPEVAYSTWTTPATLALGALALAMNMFGPPPAACVTHLRGVFRAAGSPRAAEALAGLLHAKWRSVLFGRVWQQRVGNLSSLPATWQLMPPVTMAWQPVRFRWPMPQPWGWASGMLEFSASTGCAVQRKRQRTWGAGPCGPVSCRGPDAELGRSAKLQKSKLNVPHGQAVCAVDHDPRRIDLGIKAILARLRPDELERALSFWRAYDGQEYRVGTIFSGTDVVVCFLETFFQVLRSKHGICVQLVHEMSVEADVAKQRFLLKMCPGVRVLFSDAKELTQKYAVDVRTGTKVAVPRFLDHVIAGWVCKSHSVENMQRGRFATCLSSGDGKSGETYKALTDYIRVHKPKRVLLENVTGILFRSRASEGGGWHQGQIHTVLADMQKLGLAVGYARTSSHFFLQPIRRNRVYIAGESLAGGSGQFDPLEFARTLHSMQRPERYPLDKFLDADLPPSRLTRPQEVRLTRKLNAQPGLRSCDAIVDVAKTFTDCAVDMLTCPRPSSAPYSVKRNRVVRGVERMRLQGMWEDRCPEIPELASSKRGDKFLSDLAGNAFTLHVVGAAFIAQSVHSAIRPEHHLRALTIRNPLLLQAIVEGVKNVENRKCSLKPGWYLLHLSKNPSDSYAAPAAGAMMAVQPWTQCQVQEMRGKVVGCCLLVAGHAYATQELAERALGIWANIAAGRYQHQIRCAGMLKQYHAADGQLGAWKVPTAVEVAVLQDDNFLALRKEWSACASLVPAAPATSGRPRLPDVLSDAGMERLSAKGAALCGRAIAPWGRHGGCADPACMTCWPCCSDENVPRRAARVAQDAVPSADADGQRRQGSKRASAPAEAPVSAVPHADADGHPRRGRKRAGRCSGVAQAPEAAGPCADSRGQGKRGKTRAALCSEKPAKRCSGLAQAADVAVPHADTDGQRRQGRKRAGRCSRVAEVAESAGPCADSDRQRKQRTPRAARCSETREERCTELDEAADVPVPHADTDGQRRQGRKRARRCSRVAEAVETAGPCADSDTQRMKGKNQRPGALKHEQ